MIPLPDLDNYVVKYDCWNPKQSIMKKILNTEKK